MRRKKTPLFKRNQRVEILLRDGSRIPGVVENAIGINGRILVKTRGTLMGVLEKSITSTEPVAPVKSQESASSEFESEKTAPKSKSKNKKTLTLAAS